MRRGLKATTITLGLLLTALSVCAQTNPPAAKPLEEEFQNEEDPTRAVFLSVRNELFNLQDGAWINAVTLRKDQALFKKRGWLGGKVGILTRFDLPQVTSHLGGATHAGLGDVYGQVVYVPWLTPRFALATGSGMTFPTATDKTLGGGQWRIAPLIAPVWYLPPKKGFFLVKFQQFVSFAGDRDRPDSTFLLTTPQLLYRFRRRWWLLADTEMKTDWERDNHASFRSGFGIGRIVSSRYGLLIKPEVPWGGHREGDWTLRISLTRYRSQ
jgi:hypothetical protein